MALNVTQKLIRSHLLGGEMRPGAEIALKVDQVLLQDVLGILVMLELEAMGVERSRVEVRINLATAFDCPFDGRMPVGPVIELLGRLAALRPDVEICLCDTTGRATPDHVAQLSAAAMACFPRVAAWAYHAHDTYGLGPATTYAAYRAGLRVFDAAAGGLGGCPFAPGATGNVATEDVVWMFERMGIGTGVDLDALLPVAQDAAALPGASAGGRARNALLPCKAA